jgi:hypothetical protein
VLVRGPITRTTSHTPITVPCTSSLPPATSYSTFSKANLSLRPTKSTASIVMVNDEDLRKIERLAEQYHIRKRLQSDAWPAAHESVFQHIQELGQTTFQAYSDSIDAQSDRRFWRRQNRARTLSLVQQASHLLRNEANESAWRMGIENTILDRFSVEVAWCVKLLQSPDPVHVEKLTTLQPNMQT